MNDTNVRRPARNASGPLGSASNVARDTVTDPWAHVVARGEGRALEHLGELKKERAAGATRRGQSRVLNAT